MDAQVSSFVSHSSEKGINLVVACDNFQKSFIAATLIAEVITAV